MIQKLQQLSEKALALIKDPSVNDPAVMAHLGPIPAKLQRMEIQFQALEQEATQVEELIKSFSHRPQRANGSTGHGSATNTTQEKGLRVGPASRIASRPSAALLHAAT